MKALIRNSIKEALETFPFGFLKDWLIFCLILTTGITLLTKGQAPEWLAVYGPVSVSFFLTLYGRWSFS